MIQRLKGNDFALLVAVLSILAQTPHTYFVMHSLSHPELDPALRVAQAMLTALVLDMALLFYTVRNRSSITWYFAISQIFINVYYYYTTVSISEQMIPAVIISVMLPVSIHFYSQELKEEVHAKAEPEQAVHAQVHATTGPDTKLSMQIAEEIRGLHAGDPDQWSNTTLGARYGVHASTISKILKGKIWKEMKIEKTYGPQKTA